MQIDAFPFDRVRVAVNPVHKFEVTWSEKEAAEVVNALTSDRSDKIASTSIPR